MTIKHKPARVGKVMAGAGLGMLAALSAGAYYIYGSDAAKKRNSKIRGWVLRAKGEVLEKLENLKDVSEETYDDVINTVATKYKGLKNVNQEELDELVFDLKKHWKNIKRHLDEAAGETKTKTKRAVRRTKKVITNTKES